MRFSEDVDLLKFEPELFRELAWTSQVLCDGKDGVLTGSSFSSATGDFTGCGLQSGNVIHLCDSEGKVDGCYEVISIESAAQMTVSVLRAEKSDDVIPPPAGEGAGAITYRICTYAPQGQLVAGRLLEYFGVGASDILNSDDLRLVSVNGILSMVFAGLYSNKSHQSYRDKYKYYSGMYDAGRARLRLQIDGNGDGMVERVVSGSEICIRRV